MTEQSMESNPAQEHDEPSRRTKHMHRSTEYVVLGILIVILWGAIAMPSIFYFSLSTSNTGKNHCSQELNNGTVCYSALELYQPCTLGQYTSGSVLVSPIKTQEKIYNILTSTSITLTAINASNECIEIMLQLLCAYYFGICSDDGDLYLPTREECIIVNTVCAKNVSDSSLFSVGSLLPECDALSPADSSKGSRNECISSNTINEQLPGKSSDPSDYESYNSINNMEPSRKCSPDFYLEDSTGFCHPECTAWTSPQDDTKTWLKPLVIATCILQIVGAVFFYVLSCANFKRMFSFPSVYILVVELCLLVTYIITLFQYLSQSSYFCESRDYLHTFKQPTVLCAIGSGIAHFFSMFGQLTLVVHVAAIFFAIKFPFMHIDYKAKGHMKYIHTTLTALAFLISCVLTAVRNSVTLITTELPFGCEPSNTDINCYTQTFPMSIAIAISCTLLLVIFGELMKVAFFNYKNSGRNKWPSHITKAEMKVIGSFVVYLVYGLCLTTACVIHSANHNNVVDNKSSYFACELHGRTLRGECERQSFVNIHVVRLVAASYIIAAGYLVINISYALSREEVRKYWTRVQNSVKALSSSSPSSSISSNNVSPRATVISMSTE